ncbi:MAG: hypothetical protein PHR66_14620 [Desulfuromonadaceae bacterium]|nr:hypothetical protein [Desulfuromonadaceae bacterium]
MDCLEDALWDAMLDSEMNALYYGYIARRYESREQQFQIFVAVLTTGSISTLQLWKTQTSWFRWIWIYDLMSVVSIVVSVSLPFVNFGKIANNARSLRIEFKSFASEYESVWIKRNSLPREILHDNFIAIKNDEIKQTNIDSNMPRDIKLLEKCQNEIIKAKHLNSTVRND